MALGGALVRALMFVRKETILVFVHPSSLIYSAFPSPPPPALALAHFVRWSVRRRATRKVKCNRYAHQAQGQANVGRYHASLHVVKRKERAMTTLAHVMSAGCWVECGEMTSSIGARRA